MKFILAAFAAATAMCMDYPSYGQDMYGKEDLCMVQRSSTLDDAEVGRLGLADKLSLYKKKLPPALKQPEPKVVVIACDGLQGEIVDKDFDYNARPPLLVSVTLYVTVETLRKLEN